MGPIILSALVVVFFVGLRLWHDRQIKQWIEAGLIARKPRQYQRYSRYRSK